MLKTLRKLFFPPLLVWRWLAEMVAVILIYTAGVVWLQSVCLFGPFTNWGREFTVVNAVILGMLLTFSTNEAKRRFWEGRSLWGQLLNDLRNLAVMAKVLAKLNPEDQEKWARLLIAFANALRGHLRGKIQLCELSGFEHDTRKPLHVPLFLADEMLAVVVGWHRAGHLDDVGLRIIDEPLRNLLNVCGGCERIRNTPVPSSYRALLHQGMLLNVLLAPFYLAPQLGYGAVPIMGVTSYFVLGVELTALHIDEPFGNEGDDLPLDDLCQTVRRSMSQTLTSPSAST